MGNGIVEPGEECDDGNLKDGDGCDSQGRLEISSECTENRQCASGLCIKGVCSQCMSDDQCGGLACRNGTCVNVCGNGVVDAGEECDDGVRNDDLASNACRTNCRNPRCGDGVADRNEQCDDGNGVSGDGCDRLCRIEVQTVNIDLPTSDQVASVVTQTRAPAGKTGPAAIGIMAAGAAAGWAWMRRRKV